MKIPLGRSGKYAIVDDEDYDELVKRKWHYSDGYARRNYYKDHKYHTVRMHNQIMNPPKGMTVDHINLNRLDNRKSNLRICTIAENVRNSTRYSLKYNARGIYKRTSRWGAKIRLNKKDIYIGTFNTKEEAMAAYDKAAIKYHGEFASLNSHLDERKQIHYSRRQSL